jgi:REP element-mobilizing transposase RayT
MECNPVMIGGYKNHVHILCLLSKKITQMKLLEELKKSSSKWIKTKGSKYLNFYWQNGYGIFSVNPAQVDIVREYITNQEKHHKKLTFKEEFRKFLHKYDIDYDERYVWD